MLVTVPHSITETQSHPVGYLPAMNTPDDRSEMAASHLERSARERHERIAALASERRAAVERAGSSDALAFPSEDELHDAMLAGRRDP